MLPARPELVAIPRTFRSLSRSFRTTTHPHVRDDKLYREQRERLLLIKAGPRRRLRRKAVLISEFGQNVKGQPLKVLAKEMRLHLAVFGGRNSTQRSNPRSVASEYTHKAAA